MFNVIETTPLAPGEGAPCCMCGVADTWRVADHTNAICPACIEAKNAQVPGREVAFLVHRTCQKCKKLVTVRLAEWQRAYQHDRCLDCRC